MPHLRKDLEHGRSQPKLNKADNQQPQPPNRNTLSSPATLFNFDNSMRRHKRQNCSLHLPLKPK